MNWGRTISYFIVGFALLNVDLPGILSYRVESLKFRATNLDLVLALVATFLLPLACWALFDWSGALLPLVLYYGVFCVAIVLWRKKSLEYVETGELVIQTVHGAVGGPDRDPDRRIFDHHPFR